MRDGVGCHVSVGNVIVGSLRDGDGFEIGRVGRGIPSKMARFYAIFGRIYCVTRGYWDLMKDELERLRQDILTGRRRLRITTHAQVEAAKDGLLLADLRHVFETGRIIETYPAEQRMLLYEKTTGHQIPVHVVLEVAPDSGIIVTAYVPDTKRWFGDVRRRRKK
jgi:hypothetical protein